MLYTEYKLQSTDCEVLRTSAMDGFSKLVRSKSIQIINYLSRHIVRLDAFVKISISNVLFIIDSNSPIYLSI